MSSDKTYNKLKAGMFFISSVLYNYGVGEDLARNLKLSTINPGFDSGFILADNVGLGASAAAIFASVLYYFKKADGLEDVYKTFDYVSGFLKKIGRV